MVYNLYLTISKFLFENMSALRVLQQLVLVLKMSFIISGFKLFNISYILVASI